MENETTTLFTKTYFKTSFDKEDVSKLSIFKKWVSLQEKEGKTVVRCPHCWGYEIFIIPSNHRCVMCHKLYCQKCLQPCVEDEVQHDHQRSCWSKFKGLIHIMKDWGIRGEKYHDIDKSLLTKASLIFIFGNHVLYSIKYFDFFKKNKIIDDEFTHKFFMYTNLIVNIIYCIVFNIIFFEFFFVLFLPAFFIKCYYNFIAYNWIIVLEFEVDESPITELTVRGKGYDMY